MNPSRDPSRADFLRLTLGGAAVAALAAACGGSSTPPADAAAAEPDAPAGNPDAAVASADAAPGACDGAVNVSIANNHGHVLVVPLADVLAGVDKTYDIQGASPHTHSVTITATDFLVMKSADPIQVTSTSAGHTHVVTVMCA